MNAIKQQQAAPASINGFGSGGNVMQGGDDPLPIDLHDLHLQQSQGGYDNPVNLERCEASSMAASLRGLIAVTAVLQAGMDTDCIKLVDWLKGGLLDAVHELAANTQYTLEAANSRTEKERAAA